MPIVIKNPLHFFVREKNGTEKREPALQPRLSKKRLRHFFEFTRFDCSAAPRGHQNVQRTNFSEEIGSEFTAHVDEFGMKIKELWLPDNPHRVF